MKATRFLPPLLAGATLILLGSNAIPTALRKHRLHAERTRLLNEFRHEQARAVRLKEEIRALEHDPFYVERLLVESLNMLPQGSRRWDDRETDE